MELHARNSLRMLLLSYERNKFNPRRNRIPPKFKSLGILRCYVMIDELSLIIPAHNEEKKILKTLKSYSEILPKKYKDYEIIVVCNGCSDDTFNMVRENYKNDERLKLINIEKAGKGNAVLNGFKIANKKYIGFIDADDPFESKQVLQMVDSLDEYDGVIASKWKGRKFSEVPEGFTKKVLGRGWNFLVEFLLKLKFKDTQGGAKFFKKEVIDRMDKDFICDGFEFDVELLHKVNKNNFRVLEHYIPLKRGEGSTFKFKYIFKMFNKLIKIWRLSK